MLNPNWKKVYKETDWDTWEKIRSIAPEYLSYALKYINDLLDKYYRTNSGNFLYKVHDKARLHILERTMGELEEAVEQDKKELSKKWGKQQEKEESIETKLQREEDLYERASIKISSRDKV